MRAMRPLATSRASSDGGSAREITHDRDLLGHLLECLRKRRALLGHRVGFVEVVEDHDARMGQDREEVAEEGTGEARQVLLGLRGEMGQYRRGLADELLRRDAEVVHEGRRVGVADVALVPEVTQPARLEVARDERRLARAGRGGYPDDRARRRLIEAREKTRPRECVVQLGPGQFGERRADGQVATGRAQGRPVAARLARAELPLRTTTCPGGRDAPGNR